MKHYKNLKSLIGGACFFASSLLLPLGATVDFSKVPDILYEGSILTFQAKGKTLLNSPSSPFTVSLVTADNQEVVLEAFISDTNNRAQVLLPTLPEGSKDIFRVILKASGGNVSSNSPEGAIRLLTRKPENVNLNLSSEKPIDPQINLNAAPSLPAGADSGVLADVGVGPTGPQGPAGPQGPVGPTGWVGASGKTVLNGTANPVAQGVDGDFYINTVTNSIFGPKVGAAWGSGVSLVGPTGATGAAGTNGKTVLNGTVNPILQGVDGDFYINTTSKSIFGPKTAGAWGAGTSLIGPTGATGPQGPQGPAGTTVLDLATLRDINGQGAAATFNVAGVNFIKIQDSTVGGDSLRYLTGGVAGQRLIILVGGSVACDVYGSQAPFAANEIDFPGAASTLTLQPGTMFELIHDGTIWRQISAISVN